MTADDDYDKLLSELVGELDPELAAQWEAELAWKPQAVGEATAESPEATADTPKATVEVAPRSPRRSPQTPKAATKTASAAAPDPVAQADPAPARLLAEATAAAAAERSRGEDAAGS